MVVSFSNNMICDMKSSYQSYKY